MKRSPIATGLTAAAIIGALASLVAAASLTHERALALRAEVDEHNPHVSVPSPQAARIMALGANEAMTDMVWVLSLVYYGDGLNRDNGVPDVDMLTRLMNTLDPRFRRAYQWGAYATTFRHATATQAEYVSSVEILRRGIKVFPDDWELNWLLGLRLFFDVKPPPVPDGTVDKAALDRQREEGAFYIEHAMHCVGAPSNLASTAATMRTELGQKERGLRELREMLLTTEDPKARAALQKRYADLATDDATGQELERAAQEFFGSWKRDLPFVTPSFYVVVGPPPTPGWDLAKLLEGPEFGTGEDAFGHPGVPPER